MPMPQQYQRASPVFDKILNDLKETLDLATRNQAYTCLQSVLIVFRRRLRPSQILAFADLLPPVVRAIFVADWNDGEFVSGFGKKEELTEEVRSIRRHHNFSGDNVIEGVTSVLRGTMDEGSLEDVLASISPDATDFWSLRQ
ncbi:MAG: DUF2267 domain-containing protein [Alphaproteobacteria bacterium]|nr:DUF2267 domain-containing protein [Alphaproteobacteria bacterium]